jgi:hypothetical protein
VVAAPMDAGMVFSAACFDCAGVLGGRNMIDSAVGLTGGIDSPFLALNGHPPTPALKKERKAAHLLRH